MRGLWGAGQKMGCHGKQPDSYFLSVHSKSFVMGEFSIRNAISERKSQYELIGYTVEFQAGPRAKPEPPIVGRIANQSGSVHTCRAKKLQRFFHECRTYTL